MYSNINDSLNSLVYKTHIILKGKLQSLLNDHDITSGQWAILRKLYERDGYNQKELSIESFKEQAVITRSLDILEKKGLIERKKSQNDRREFLVCITPEGRKLIEEVQPNTAEYQNMISSILKEDELETLKKLLSKLCEGLISQ